MVKRTLDIALAAGLILVLSLPMLIVAMLIKLTSPGPVLHWSDRVGRNNRIFKMPKFRTMRLDTPQLATHLLADPDRWITPLGSILRKTSIDELPQIWSVLKGDMSLVGPRPALFNQVDLIELRTAYGVHVLTPGITGWAQVNGRDELPIPKKVEADAHYLNRQSILFDLQVLLLTMLNVLKQDGIRQSADPTVLADARSDGSSSAPRQSLR